MPNRSPAPPDQCHDRPSHRLLLSVSVQELQRVRGERSARPNTTLPACFLALIAQQIASVVGEDDAYEQAHRRVLALLDRGFHLGGRIEATRKIRKPFTKPAARSVVNTYAPWCVEGITTSDIMAAFQIEDQARLGFWNALIVAVAARGGARRVASEDPNAGQSIAGITIHNPFETRVQAKSRK